ncbi:MAG: hypothetical protein M3Y69_02370 [Verrucomicrobiota bacterium]|nr:hypothetical protein [Verrucomicrobiota bacterium]
MTKSILVTALTAASLAATIHAADDLPQRPDFARYEAMMTRSPFAVATAVAVAAPVSNFAKDLYVANAAHSPNGDLVTVASSTDKNLKLYLSTAQPVDGYSISNIEWSERVGSTKVTLSKDGQFATIGFNQALLSAPIAANAPPLQMPPVGLPPPLQATGAIPQPQQPQAHGFGAPNPPAGGAIRPAPIPMLPTPPPRVRTVIQRNPGAPTPSAETTPAEL